MTPFPSAAIIATFVKRRRVNGLTLLEILVSGCLFFFNVQRVNGRNGTCPQAQACAGCAWESASASRRQLALICRFLSELGYWEQNEGAKMEPTSGLEPLTCRLRIGCSTN
jgi:hypothetical protein